MMTSDVSISPAKRLTWARLVTITLIVMLIGVILGSIIINRLGLFRPPLLPYTVAIYLLLWLPVFIVGLLLKPGGSRKPLVWLVVLGIVVGILGLTLLGPAFNYTAGSCQPAPLPGQSVRYECLSQPNYQQAQLNYILEGNEGSPFVQVID